LVRSDTPWGGCLWTRNEKYIADQERTRRLHRVGQAVPGYMSRASDTLRVQRGGPRARSRNIQGESDPGRGKEGPAHRLEFPGHPQGFPHPGRRQAWRVLLLRPFLCRSPRGGRGPRCYLQVRRRCTDRCGGEAERRSLPVPPGEERKSRSQGH